jgi:hypothetical protein
VCWCVDMVMCWVLMCWCVGDCADVLARYVVCLLTVYVLICWSVDLVVLICWCVDVLDVDVLVADWCVDGLMCCVKCVGVCWCVDWCVDD